MNFSLKSLASIQALINPIYQESYSCDNTTFYPKFGEPTENVVTGKKKKCRGKRCKIISKTHITKVNKKYTRLK